MASQPTPITDPQTHDAYGSADPNSNSVENAPVAGDADQDNQRILPRQSPSGVSRGVQQLGSPNIYADSANNRVIVEDGMPRVLMGNQPFFGEGFYVSKPTVDATKAFSPDQFIFNSNQDILKVVKSGSATFGFTSSTISTGRIPHNLGFAPAVSSFLNNVGIGSIAGNANLPLPTWVGASIDTINQVVNFSSWLFAFTDSQYFYATLFNSTGVGINLPITYYLFQETATAPMPPPPTV